MVNAPEGLKSFKGQLPTTLSANGNIFMHVHRHDADVHAEKAMCFLPCCHLEEKAL